MLYFHPNMNQNSLSGRAPPGPAGRAYSAAALPRLPSWA